MSVFCEPLEPPAPRRAAATTPGKLLRFASYDSIGHGSRSKMSNYSCASPKRLGLNTPRPFKASAAAYSSPGLAPWAFLIQMEVLSREKPAREEYTSSTERFFKQVCSESASCPHAPQSLVSLRTNTRLPRGAHC